MAWWVWSILWRGKSWWWGLFWYWGWVELVWRRHERVYEWKLVGRLQQDRLMDALLTFEPALLAVL